MATSCCLGGTDDSSSSTESGETKSETDVTTFNSDTSSSDITDSGATTGSSSNVTNSSVGASDVTGDESKYDPCIDHKGGEATCISKAICDICGEKYGELTPHIEEAIECKAPTCTETGLTEGKKCTICGGTMVEQEEIPANGHSYEKGVCIKCGAVAPASEGLKFELSSDGTYYIVVGKATCSDKDIVIPNTYKDIPVGSIGSSEFANSDSITGVVIGEKVTNICDYAFKDCNSLVSVKMGDSVISIGDYSFNSCTSLISITKPNSVTRIGSEAFNGCTNLTIYCEAESEPEG